MKALNLIENQVENMPLKISFYFLYTLLQEEQQDLRDQREQHQIRIQLLLLVTLDVQKNRYGTSFFSKKFLTINL